MASDSLGPLEFQILTSLLELPRNSYGITIAQRVKERSRRNRSLGAIYAALARLEGKGLVSSWWGEPTTERGGRRKRLYKVTAVGAKAHGRTQKEYTSLGSAAPQESEV